MSVQVRAASRSTRRRVAPKETAQVTDLKAELDLSRVRSLLLGEGRTARCTELELPPSAVVNFGAALVLTWDEAVQFLLARHEFPNTSVKWLDDLLRNQARLWNPMVLHKSRLLLRPRQPTFARNRLRRTFRALSPAVRGVDTRR